MGPETREVVNPECSCKSFSLSSVDRKTEVAQSDFYFRKSSLKASVVNEVSVVNDLSNE